MKRFIVKILALIVVFPFVYLTVYMLIDFVINRKSADNSLFVWGDSQTYRGINLPKLKKEIGINVYSSAEPGASIYDFLVFADKVPKNSKVLISISELALLRKKDKDRNMSTLSLFAFETLYKNNYTITDLYAIAKRNFKIRKLFDVKSTLHQSFDKTLTPEKFVKSYKENYYSSTMFLNDKEKASLEGINRLQEKGCKIYFVKFPFHSAMQKMKKESGIDRKVDAVYNHIFQTLGISKVDSIYLNQNEQIMFDYNHLNAKGANQVTDYLATFIKSNKTNDTYIFQLKD
ncbi:MAG: hypothetical protein M9887_00295 [Chitinophagales bacterium]|nr:hypothetical protein [Chitinophagales bacterium]